MDSHSMWSRRPRVHEDDEDLLRQSDEYLRAKSQPAAKCVNKRPNQTTSHSQKVEEKTDPVQQEQPSSNCSGKVPVVFDIVERDVVDIHLPIQMPMSMPGGFPLPQRRPKNVNSGKKVSIFLQQMGKKEPPNRAKFLPSENHKAATSGSAVIDGSGLGNSENCRREAQELHEENLQKIASMSEEEVLKMRDQLLSSLNQANIEFLRSKKKAGRSGNGSIRPMGRSAFASSRAFVKEKENLSGDPLEETVKDSGGADRDAIILENLPETETLQPSRTDKKVASPLDEELSRRVSIDLPLEELPIHPGEAGQWLHMESVEVDKLAWMTQLPKPIPIDKKTSYTARFDFEGNLLSRDVDVPTQMGLHHHSNEPEVAGYSIEELFLLTRSSFQSQRVTALETLSRILGNYWDGRFDGCFQSSLLSTLLDAGLAPLLRWSLDANTTSSVAAAVLCVHRLLVCKCDELCLDWSYCWLFGHFSPSLMSKDVEPTPNLDELTDVSLVRMDVVIGFLRMDILPRFRYILRVLCPASSVCKLIIEICIRIARHSPESAKKVAEFPDLLESIFLKFLPISWSYNPNIANTSNFYCPMASAVKLVRVMSSASKELALHLIGNYEVVDLLMCYLTIDPSDGKLPPVEVQRLMIETLKLWHTLMSYGTCTDIYIDLFPLLLRQFNFCQSLSLNTNIKNNIANYEYASHFLKALEAVVVALQSRSSFSTYGANNHVVAWSDVSKLVEMGKLCLQRWLHEFSVGPTNYHGQVLLASCLNFFAAFGNSSTREIEGADIGDILEVFRSVLSRHLRSCVASEEFVTLMSSLRSRSVLLYRGLPGAERDSRVLPSIGSVLWKDDVLPLLKEGSPFPLFIAVVNILCVSSTFQDDLWQEVVMLLPTLCFHDYFSHIVDLSKPFSHWFGRFEILVLYQIMDLYKRMDSMRDSYPSIPASEDLYKASLVLACCVGHPYEMILERIFREFVFHRSFLKTGALESGSKSVEEQLTGLCDFYVNTFVPNSVLQKSRYLLQLRISEVTSYSYEIQESLLPGAFWSFAPLVDYYRQSKSKESATCSPQDITSGIVKCLRWIHYSNSICPFSTNTEVPRSVRFACLCLVFLIDVDVFMEEEVRGALPPCLQDVLSTNPRIHLVPMRGKSLPTFEEIYTELLVQFESVSFGDELFARFLAIPLQQCYPSNWKLMLFSDHEQIIYFFNVPLHKLPVPILNYLTPVETEVKLLKKYYQALSSGKLTHRRSPLLFLMAVHHLYHYVHSKQHHDVEFQQTLLRSLTRSSEKEFSKYIMKYAGPSVDSELGFHLKSEDANAVAVLEQ